jgi:hypothetical protein
MGLGPAGKHVIGWALAFQGDIPFVNGEFSKAQSLYEMSIMALGEVGNLNLKAYPLRRLGYLALKLDNLTGAKKFFKESLALNSKLKHQVGTIGSIAAIGALALAQKNETRSVTLFGAVDAQLKAKSLRLLPSDQLEYSRSVTNLKNQLDEQAFTDAWAAGRSMTLENVVEFALEE